jgi:hypothetical protein
VFREAKALAESVMWSEEVTVVGVWRGFLAGWYYIWPV